MIDWLIDWCIYLIQLPTGSWFIYLFDLLLWFCCCFLKPSAFTSGISIDRQSRTSCRSLYYNVKRAHVMTRCDVINLPSSCVRAWKASAAERSSCFKGFELFNERRMNIFWAELQSNFEIVVCKCVGQLLRSFFFCAMTLWSELHSVSSHQRHSRVSDSRYDV